MFFDSFFNFPNAVKSFREGHEVSFGERVDVFADNYIDFTFKNETLLGFVVAVVEFTLFLAPDRPVLGD